MSSTVDASQLGLDLTKKPKKSKSSSAATATAAATATDGSEKKKKKSSSSKKKESKEVVAVDEQELAQIEESSVCSGGGGCYCSHSHHSLVHSNTTHTHFFLWIVKQPWPKNTTIVTIQQHIQQYNTYNNTHIYIQYIHVGIWCIECPVEKQ